MACILLIPALRDAFQLTGLSSAEWGIALGLSLLSVVQIEMVKLANRIRRDSQPAD